MNHSPPNLRATPTRATHCSDPPPSAALWVSYAGLGCALIWGLTLALSGITSGCVEDVKPPKLDAYVGEAQAGTALPDLTPLAESRYLNFESRSATSGETTVDLFSDAFGNKRPDLSNALGPFTKSIGAFRPYSLSKLDDSGNAIPL